MNRNDPCITLYPLITVITVVYNAVGVIEETIISILGQEYPNLHYIVIDGGSTDGTVEIIRKYEGSLFAWISEKDNGIYDAMNKGWARADQESFILFLGAGDKIISLPQQMLQYSSSDVIYGRVMLGGETIFLARYGLRLKIFNSLHHQALLMRKSLHPAPPFSLSFPKYADFDLNQRLMKQGACFIFEDSFWSYARPGGVSDGLDLAETLQVVRKNYGVFWFAVTFTAYFVVKILPLLKHFRPIQKFNQKRG